MNNISQFKSRTVTVTCTPEEFFRFVTNMRNFGQFIPAAARESWKATDSECSFNISPMGEVALSIESKTEFSEVLYSGKVLQTTSFRLYTFITDAGAGMASVNLRMDAELNPILKMMASGPIERFLDELSGEMERFRGWTI